MEGGGWTSPARAIFNLLSSICICTLCGFNSVCYGQVGPWVNNSGVPIAPPVYASAQIAGLATNAVTANNGLSPFETLWMTNTFTEWWEADMVGATNGQSLSKWIGRDGNVLTGACIYVSQVPGLGRPGMYFDNSGTKFMTNGSLLGGCYTNSGTLVCLYTFPPTSMLGAGRNLLLSADNPSRTAYVDFFAALSSGNVNLQMAINDNNQNWSWDITHIPTTAYGNNCSHLVIWGWSPTNGYVLDNGKCFVSAPNGGASDIGVPYFATNDFQGVLGVGGMPVSSPGAWSLNGYVSELLLSSNFMPETVVDQMSAYFLRKYGMLNDQIVLLGDSLPQGWLASYNGDWSAMLASNYPGWQIINNAESSTTTAHCLTNLSLVASGATMPGRKVAIIWNALVNDRGAGLNVITNAQIGIAQMLASNGIPSVLVMPCAAQDADQTLWGGQDQRYAYCNVMSNAWPQYFSAVVNLAQDPYIGYSNAWTNLTFYSSAFLGYDHLTNAGYAEAYPYLQSAINYVLSPANLTFTGSTNQPPPWQGPGWSVMYQGHLYNSLGGNSWILIK